MELHPQETVHLRKNITKVKYPYPFSRRLQGALALSPPTPRRGFIFIDPSYEVKQEYQAVVEFIEKLHRKWPVGVISVWYPMLKSGYHQTMVAHILAMNLKDTVVNECQFADPETARESTEAVYY